MCGGRLSERELTEELMEDAMRWNRSVMMG